MRFSAPPHTTSIDLTTGPVPVVDGFVDVPDDIGPGDVAGLAVHGFVAAPDKASTKASTSSGKAADA